MKKTRLNQDWEHYRGSLGGVWEVWRQDKLQNHFNVPWHSVELPHCFNARDTVDPDVAYYQGQGWYRNYLDVVNPYPGGRTLLHFEGAGQKSKVFVYTEEVAAHVGGYDEFVVDITEASKQEYSAILPHGVGG
jgi:beta-galactosidase